MKRRRWLIDTLSRSLGLRCPSVFRPPGQVRVYRCAGHPGHSAVLHGGDGAAWGENLTDAENPAAPVILHTAVLRLQLERVVSMVLVRDHLIQATASTAGYCEKLIALLEEMWEQAPSVELEQALAVARLWDDSLQHLHTCTGADAHDPGHTPGDATTTAPTD